VISSKTTRLGFIILGSKVWNTIPICLASTSKILMNLLVWFFWSIVIHLQKQQNLSPFSIKKYFLHLLFMQNSDFLNQWNFLFLFPIQLLQHGLIIIMVAGFPTQKYPNGSILSGKPIIA
jgi:hypothetical protein